MINEISKCKEFKHFIMKLECNNNRLIKCLINITKIINNPYKVFKIYVIKLLVMKMKLINLYNRIYRM